MKGVERTDTWAFLRRTFRLVRADGWAAALATLALIVPVTLLDSFASPDVSSRLTNYSGLLSIILQLMLTTRTLRRQGFADPTVRVAIGSYIAVLIVSGVGILLGMFLLVLPGLYLWARWILAVPLVVSEGASTATALRESWHRTAPPVTELCAALVLINIWLLIGIVMGMSFYPVGVPAPLPLALLTNVLCFVPQVLSWYLAMAAFALLRQPGAGDLERIFA